MWYRNRNPLAEDARNRDQRFYHLTAPASTWRLVPFVKQLTGGFALHTLLPVIWPGTTRKKIKKIKKNPLCIAFPSP